VDTLFLKCGEWTYFFATNVANGKILLDIAVLEQGYTVDVNNKNNCLDSLDEIRDDVLPHFLIHLLVQILRQQGSGPEQGGGR